MLFTQYPTIVQNYFLLAFLTCLGTLQWVAGRRGQLSLSLLGPWGLGRMGVLAGWVGIIGSFAWFFRSTPGLFAPGLAGGELSALFAAGGGCALVITRLAGACWQKIASSEKFSPGFGGTCPAGWGIKNKGKNPPIS
ncbi:MAG: hypothetical protein U0401_26775 [Anaerolineae bacterium]